MTGECLKFMKFCSKVSGSTGFVKQISQLASSAQVRKAGPQIFGQARWRPFWVQVGRRMAMLFLDLSHPANVSKKAALNLTEILLCRRVHVRRVIAFWRLGSQSEQDATYSGFLAQIAAAIMCVEKKHIYDKWHTWMHSHNLYMCIHIIYTDIYIYYMVCLHEFISLSLLGCMHWTARRCPGQQPLATYAGSPSYWMAHHGLLISAMTRAWHHYCHSKLRYFQGEFRDMSCQERRWEDWNPRWFGLVELALNPSRIPGEIWFFRKDFHLSDMDTVLLTSQLSPVFQWWKWSCFHLMDSWD